VGRRPDDPVAQLALEPRHQRKRDEKRHHAHRHAQDRDQRDERNEGLLPPGEEIPQGDEQFEGQIHQRLTLEK